MLLTNESFRRIRAILRLLNEELDVMGPEELHDEQLTETDASTSDSETSDEGSL